jgi:hypothetical protein
LMEDEHVSCWALTRVLDASEPHWMDGGVSCAAEEPTEEPTEETEGEDVHWSYSKPKSEGA